MANHKMYVHWLGQIEAVASSAKQMSSFYQVGACATSLSEKETTWWKHILCREPEREDRIPLSVDVKELHPAVWGV